MHQEVAVVHQDPLSCAVPFDADRPLADFLETLFDLVANCMPLSGISYRTQDKVVRERRNLF
jgi:hypothetical protein